MYVHNITIVYLLSLCFSKIFDSWLFPTRWSFFFFPSTPLLQCCHIWPIMFNIVFMRNVWLILYQNCMISISQKFVSRLFHKKLVISMSTNQWIMVLLDYTIHFVITFYSCIGVWISSCHASVCLMLSISITLKISIIGLSRLSSS